MRLSPRTRARTTGYIAAAVAAVLALIAIFSHGVFGIAFEMAAILVWLGIGIGVAANEKRNRTTP
jgi:uncharacterized membrane protein